MTEQRHDIAIIGTGGAGQMAMLRSVLNHLDTVVFQGDTATTKRSRAAWVSEVDNIPGMFEKKRPIGATTREVIKWIGARPELNRRLTLYKEAVTEIRKDEVGFIVKTGIRSVKSRFVLLCTGVMDIQPEIGGSIEPILPFANRNDVLYCIRCDGHRTAGKNCAVIGSGNGAGWIAIMLHERYCLPKITILPHGENFDPDPEVAGLIRHYGIEVVPGEITDVLGDARSGLEGFTVGDRQVAVQTAFVSLGSIVYNALAKSLGVKLDDRDHVLTDAKGHTNVDGFYAAGDLVSGKKKQVYTAWDMAVDAVDQIDARIRKSKRPLID